MKITNIRTFTSGVVMKYFGTVIFRLFIGRRDSTEEEGVGGFPTTLKKGGGGTDRPDGPTGQALCRIENPK